MPAIPQLLLTALNSNSGKTTFCLALLRLLTQRGCKAQAFKCGPDYLDCIWHEQANGRKSFNLDVKMASAEHVKNLYATQIQGSQAAIVEGVMGFLDGYNQQQGSTAELAQLLGLPVAVVINAEGLSYSLIALLKGLEQTAPKTRWLGVFLNKVRSPRHLKHLQLALDNAQWPLLGYLPKHPKLKIESRYLGLKTESPDSTQLLDQLAAELALSLDWDKLNTHSQTPLPKAKSWLVEPSKIKRKKPLRTAIAKDAAFQFLYPANVQQLEQLGPVHYFSPLQDTHLPEADWLYFPGGYPELHLGQLAANQPLKQAIRQFCAAQKPVLAECGGMLYLSQSLEDAHGQPHSLVGVLDGVGTMAQPKLQLGYRTAKIHQADWEIKGHEFHYSTWKKAPQALNQAVVQNAWQQNVDCPIYKIHNVHASYMHSYWGESLAWIQHLLATS